MGNREENLGKAWLHISKLEKTQISVTSALCESEAWGKKDQPDFLNIALMVETYQEPHELMKNLIAIEEKMGRIRKEKWGPRLIDIDILFYGKLSIQTPGLVIPHPEIQNRKFVLLNLCALDPTFIHPALNKKMSELLEACPDHSRATLTGQFNLDHSLEASL
jgi:2-amino-4-hydroxy-6-hydroxymethyldihydropteridine diphosphokinase